jgi:FkbM family methyltransferase
MKSDFFVEKKHYNNKILKKNEFIEQMHTKYHSLLFAYCQELYQTDISQIEISDQKLIMTIRQSGIKFVCDPYDQRTMPIEILNFGSYEKDEMNCIFELLNKITNNPNILDIGANCGYYSMHFALKYPLGKVYAFEPVPYTYELLEKNIFLNNFKNILTFNFGFSNKKQKEVVYFYEKGGGNSSLQNLSDREDVKKVICNFETLDSFFKERIETIDFIKCDVEGAELLVIEGGIELIKKEKPILFIELLRKWAQKFNYHPNKVLNVLIEVGYLPYSFSPSGLKLISQIDESTMETNFIFLHKIKHQDLIESR